MKMFRFHLILLALASVIVFEAYAAEMRPFVSGSYTQIKREHVGKSFLLALWSVDCAPCHDELASFSRLLKKHADFRLVLVSTDVGVGQKALNEMLRRHGIERAQVWVFADDYVERLRFEIDRQWRGELPRSYFVNAKGRARANSGKLDTATIEAWLKG